MLPVKIIRTARGYILGKVYGDEVAEGPRQTLVDSGRAVFVPPAVSADTVGAVEKMAAPAPERPARGKRGGA